MNPFNELLQAYFSTLDNSFTTKADYPSGSVGKSILHWNELLATQKSKVKIALVGIPDARNGISPHSDLSPDAIRNQLYMLFLPQHAGSIADLGNLIPGKTIQDSYFAVKTVCSELIQRKIIPILLGGGQNHTYGLFLACQDLGYPINLTALDSRIDLQLSGTLQSRNYLNKIIADHGKELFNFTTLGIQRYLISQKDQDLMNKLFFDMVRLGELRENIAIAEPYLRDSDLVSLDMSAIRYADNPGGAVPEPNGFTADEICQLAWYAGFSDRIKTLGIFELDSLHDNLNLSSKLAAQIIWHFMDAFFNRKATKTASSNYEKYILQVDLLEHSIVFRHDEENDKWWIELPFSDGDGENFLLVACSKADYQAAQAGEVPDRIWRIYQKIN